MGSLDQITSLKNILSDEENDEKLFSQLKAEEKRLKKVPSLFDNLPETAGVIENEEVRVKLHSKQGY